MKLLQTRNLVLVGLAIAAYGSQACSSAEQDDLGVAQKTTQASSVSIHLEDSSGNDIGSCAGPLVAEKLVLTAGHCVVNASTWRVEGAGKVVAAKRAVTPWRQFNSTLSHPVHADIALLVLDDAIKIARYPAIAEEGLKDGAKATRMHRSASGSKEFISTDATIRDGAAKGFRLAYTAEMPKGEWLDTGGALFDARGRIYGVVSAQGKKSSLLYITRVDGFNQWLTESVDECGTSGNGLSVRTWGGGWGGSSSGGGWGGSGWGGYGGDGKKLEAGAPPSSVDAGVGTGGGTGTGTGGGTGGDGSKSGPPGPNENGEVGSGANSGATCPAKPPSSASIPGGSGGAGSEGSGTNGSSTNSGANNGSNTGSGTGGGTGSGTGAGDGSGSGTGGGAGAGAPGSAGLDEEPCEGADDNPTICPPDTALCSGPGCGGCAGIASCVDGTMDYGNCACEAPASSIGNPDGLR